MLLNIHLLTKIKYLLKCNATTSYFRMNWNLEKDEFFILLLYTAFDIFCIMS